MTTKRDPAAWPADFGQGRFEQRPGWHVVDTSDHGAAHCCTSITSDSDADDAPGQGAGVFLWPMAVIAACACWALYAFLTSSPL